MRVKETWCKSALSKTGLYGFDYALNPYVGCEHNCVYCYATIMRRYSGHRELWGEFVDAKVNAPTVLRDELKRKGGGKDPRGGNLRGGIYLSSMTDPYQPLERKHQITRRCLEVLARYPVPVTVQTKSPLILRDTSILKKLNCAVGFTITTLDEEITRTWEPKAPLPGERLGAVHHLTGEGIETFVFFGPLLPFLSDGEDAICKVIKAAKRCGASYVLADRLKLYPRVWVRVERLLSQERPELIPRYRALMKGDNEYDRRLRSLLLEGARQYDIDVELCF